MYTFSRWQIKGLSFPIIVTVAILLFNGCDPSFSPIQENNHHYSIFGYLNASADTQFVRIEEIRDSLFIGTADKLGVEVRLTNTTIGESVLMQDSLFHYTLGNAHNYYTTLDIKPNHTYRLVVSRGDVASSAQTEVPDSFPEPKVTGYTVKITGIDRLIAVKTVYHYFLRCLDSSEDPVLQQAVVQHLKDTTQMRNGLIYAPISVRDDIEAIKTKRGFYDAELNCGFIVDKIEVVIAAGPPDWPDFLRLGEAAAARPSAATNVKGGVGLLGGIVTDTVIIRKTEN